MAKQRIVDTRFWVDNYTSNLDPTEKLLFLYLLTGPATNISGVYELPLKHMATDTGIDRDMVVKILERFEADGKIKFSDGWVAIKNFIKYQSMNPKVRTGIERELENAPDWARLYIDYAKPIDSLSHSNSNSNSKKKINKKDSLRSLSPTAPQEDKKNKSEFEIALDNFSDMRRKMRKPLTDHGRELIKRNLEKLYPDRVDLRVESLEQSIANGWQGVFELKEQHLDSSMYDRNGNYLGVIKEKEYAS